MLDKRITFGGEVVPAWIASPPNIIRPARKMNVTPIAGSNREVVEMEDAWDSYDQTYTLFVGDGTDNSIQPIINEVARTLYKNGWQTLVDDYEPDVFRMAYYQGPFDVENRFTRAGKFNVSFRCRPERFLISGNVSAGVNNNGNVFNPTAYSSKPLIHIEGQGNGTLTVAGVTMSFTGIVDYLNLDCERMDCYRLPSENRNNLMTGEYPVLKPGDNIVIFTGGIESVAITPRWFVI